MPLSIAGAHSSAFALWRAAKRSSGRALVGREPALTCARGQVCAAAGGVAGRQRHQAQRAP